MSTFIELSIRIDEWNDPAFVHAVEAAREQVRHEDVPVSSPGAAARAEALIRAAGYPHARVACSRSVEEAMAHIAHWEVRRDG